MVESKNPFQVLAELRKANLQAKSEEVGTGYLLPQRELMLRLRRYPGLYKKRMAAGNFKFDDKFFEGDISDGAPIKRKKDTLKLKHKNVQLESIDPKVVIIAKDQINDDDSSESDSDTEDLVYAEYSGTVLTRTKISHGRGMTLTINGFLHEGFYLNGEMHGPGRCISEDSSYEGMYKDGFPHGKGVHRILGEKYEGEFVMGEKKGTGT